MGPLCFTTGAGVTGLMMEKSPLPIQACKRIFCSTPGPGQKKREKLQRKGEGGSEAEEISLLLHAPRKNASERRGSSGPRLNSSGWTLIYAGQSERTLEKGSGPFVFGRKDNGPQGQISGRSRGISLLPSPLCRHRGSKSGGGVNRKSCE